MAGTAPESDFATFLGTRRRLVGLSQERLAERSGLSARTIGNLERGAVTPQETTAVRLATGLALSDGNRRVLLALAAQARAGRHDRPVTRLEYGAEPGRFGADLDWLLDIAGHAFTGPDAGPTVVALCGSAGSGKTALATTCAQLLAQRLSVGPSDGPSFRSDKLPTVLVELLGSQRLPLTSSAALATLVQVFDPRQRDLPLPVAERTELFRSLVGSSTGVLILDDAASERQVRPLIPTAGRWLVVITSRHRLPGLFGAQWRILTAPTTGDDGLGARAGTDPPARSHLRLDRRQRWMLGLLRELPTEEFEVRIVAEHAGLDPGSTAEILDGLVVAGLLTDTPDLDAAQDRFRWSS